MFAGKSMKAMNALLTITKGKCCQYNGLILPKHLYYRYWITAARSGSSLPQKAYRVEEILSTGC